jgi:Domain of unknown function (DUF4249)
MKKFIPILLALFGILYLISSCRPKPIDIDVPPAERKLVVTSQIIPNSFMVVGLSRTFSALESGGHQDTLQDSFLDSVLVENAIVTVTHPAGTDTLYMAAPGIYISLTILLQNYGTYTIRAKDLTTGEEVTAVTELLPRENFDSIQPYLHISGNDSIPYVHYELTDYSTGEDYYVFSYYRKSQDTSAFDVNSYFSQGTNQLAGFDLITDADFDQNGKMVRNRELPTVYPTDTIACTISHITKGYYEFLTAYKRSSSLFNQLSGEPINYPTNVDNGYGYFATHFPDIRIFALEDYW